MLETTTVRSYVTDTITDSALRADVLSDLAVLNTGTGFLDESAVAGVLGERGSVHELIDAVTVGLAMDDFAIGRANTAAFLEVNFGEVLRDMETKINDALKASFENLTADAGWKLKMQQIFSEESQRVYEAKAQQGEEDWQKPKWPPHEVHMQYLEEIWEGIRSTLDEYELELDQPLRASFMQSREQELTATNHNRRFYGTLIDRESKKPMLYFELDVPHSHAEVAYRHAPTICLSFLYGGVKIVLRARIF